MKIPIYVIGNKNKEPERVAYLDKYFAGAGVEVIYFQPSYVDNLIKAELDRFSEMTHGRLFKDAEKSIFLNFFYLFKVIASRGDEYSLIFESDVIFDGDLKVYLGGLEGFIKDVKPDAVSIGSGCDLIADSVDTDDMNFQIYEKPVVRCMDSYLFSKTGINKILDYMKTYGIFDEPIDNFLEKFIKRGDFSHYWVWPSITLQGSQNGYYKSSIQNNDALTQLQEPEKLLTNSSQTVACESQHMCPV